MNFKKYHVSKNLWNYQPDITSVGVTIHWDGEKLVFANTCTSSNNLSFNYGALPAGTYTLKANANHVPVNNLNVCIDLYQPSPFVQRKINNNEAVNGTVTFTLTEALTDARLRIRLEGGVNYDGFTLAPMLNSGDSSLPYEPYSSEVWHDIPYYQHKTATDTLTLPAVIYPNDTSITLGIKGNIVQDGTPTPDNPIQPSETGERTAQLFEYAQNATATTINTVVWTIANGVIHGSGTTISPAGQDCILVTKTGLQRNTNYPSYLTISAARDLKLPAGTYTFSYNAVAEPTAKEYKPRLIIGHNGASVNKGTATAVYNGDTFTCDGDDYVALIINTTTGYDTYEFGDFMLNSGSTPQPYEPFGYKIPILMGGTTNNVYLGEVQTTRQIKKLVLTGQENFGVSSQNPNVFFASTASLNIECLAYELICTHYAKSSTNRISDMVNNSAILSIGTFYIKDTAYETGTAFNAYLASEYNAGHPVTVWYVLSSATTGIINEPLMKIGTYADSLTTSIPCTAGENTLDVQTTVQPSEVTAGFSGWHPVQSVHERENGQWD